MAGRPYPRTEEDQLILVRPTGMVYQQDLAVAAAVNATRVDHSNIRAGLQFNGTNTLNPCDIGPEVHQVICAPVANPNTLTLPSAAAIVAHCRLSMGSGHVRVGTTWQVRFAIDTAVGANTITLAPANGATAAGVTHEALSRSFVALPASGERTLLFRLTNVTAGAEAVSVRVV